jgi:predicted DNA binding CopG/RHH family protein
VPNLKAEKERYKQIFKENVTKRKQVSLRILERYLYKLRTKALVQGVPYQTLISSVLHQYVNGELVAKN